ncbi:phosphoethanolamine transferase [Aquincola tertiaricarbonis]|uniref:phosphoethanolamine transferase n=1 Tax=Aquincola tertiaricarbonis TaxID=391953 RepID=UPI00069749E3|nr:phosphoethanolamine--lipid A transferase [Aquincola tertiaricarbonis]
MTTLPYHAGPRLALPTPTTARAAPVAGRSPLWAVLGASAWMATVGNLALWRELAALGQLQGLRGLLLGLGLAGIVMALTTALASLLAWHRTLKPALALLLLVTAASLHFMLAYRIVIDPSMLVNVLQTDAHEAADLLSARLLATLALAGGLPVLLLWRLPLHHGGAGRQALRNLGLLLGSLAMALALLLALFQPLASLMRNHKALRYQMSPLNSVWALGSVAAQPLHGGAGVLQPLGRDAQLGPSHAAGRKPPLLVLVLGETGRSGNFGLNGYDRDTTPALARLDVASLRNVWSCGTSTAASVPCMFSHLGREAYGAREHDTENLLDVLQHAGLAVLWIDNQSGCKGVCERVPHVSTSAGTDPMLCPDGSCQDMVMLQGLEQRIAALPAERRARGVVVVMHQMGSHGPAYSKRSPPQAKRFLPECTSAQLQDCSPQALVNAYDNSIAYTDQFLAATVGWLQRQTEASTAMVYLGDHGESLGENNLYLHGLPYAVAPDVQKRVPWITWLSADWQRRSGVHTACLRQQADVRRSHDDWFHSVLGLLDVHTSVYRPEHDIYAACAAG